MKKSMLDNALILNTYTKKYCYIKELIGYIEEYNLVPLIFK